MSRPLIILVDFDGTIVEHDYPRIGSPLPMAFETLSRLKSSGAKLILWTCREDDGHNINRRYLTDAVEFCRANGVKFDAVNESIPEFEFRPIGGINRKPYADVVIDDRNFGGFPGWDTVARVLIPSDDTVDMK